MVSKLPYFSIAALGWLIAILLGTLTPVKNLPDVAFNVNDKLVHLVLFLLFSVLLTVAIKKEGFLKISSGKDSVVVFIIASVVAIATELLQYFIPGRQTDIYDLIANETGVIVGLLINRLVYK